MAEKNNDYEDILDGVTSDDNSNDDKPSITVGNDGSIKISQEAFKAIFSAVTVNPKNGTYDLDTESIKNMDPQTIVILQTLYNTLNEAQKNLFKEGELEAQRAADIAGFSEEDELERQRADEVARIMEEESAEKDSPVQEEPEQEPFNERLSQGISETLKQKEGNSADHIGEIESLDDFVPQDKSTKDILRELFPEINYGLLYDDYSDFTAENRSLFSLPPITSEDFTFDSVPFDMQALSDTLTESGYLIDRTEKGITVTDPKTQHPMAVTITQKDSHNISVETYAAPLYTEDLMVQFTDFAVDCEMAVSQENERVNELAAKDAKRLQNLEMSYASSIRLGDTSVQAVFVEFLTAAEFERQGNPSFDKDPLYQMDFYDKHGKEALSMWIGGSADDMSLHMQYGEDFGGYSFEIPVTEDDFKHINDGTVYDSLAVQEAEAYASIGFNKKEEEKSLSQQYLTVEDVLKAYAEKKTDTLKDFIENKAKNNDIELAFCTVTDNSIYGSGKAEGISMDVMNRQKDLTNEVQKALSSIEDLGNATKLFPKAFVDEDKEKEGNIVGKAIKEVSRDARELLGGIIRSEGGFFLGDTVFFGAFRCDNSIKNGITLSSCVSSIDKAIRTLEKAEKGLNEEIKKLEEENKSLMVSRDPYDKEILENNLKDIESYKDELNKNTALLNENKEQLSALKDDIYKNNDAYVRGIVFAREHISNGAHALENMIVQSRLGQLTASGFELLKDKALNSISETKDFFNEMQTAIVNIGENVVKNLKDVSTQAIDAASNTFKSVYNKATLTLQVLENRDEYRTESIAKDVQDFRNADMFGNMSAKDFIEKIGIVYTGKELDLLLKQAEKKSQIPVNERTPEDTALISRASFVKNLHDQNIAVAKAINKEIPSLEMDVNMTYSKAVVEIAKTYQEAARPDVPYSSLSEEDKQVCMNMAERLFDKDMPFAKSLFQRREEELNAQTPSLGNDKPEKISVDKDDEER